MPEILDWERLVLTFLCEYLNSRQRTRRMGRTTPVNF